MSSPIVTGSAVALGASLLFEGTRTFIFDHYLLVLVVFVAIVALSPKYEEWKGGVTSILKNENEARVNQTVEKFESFFGSDSRKGGEEHSKLLSKRLNSYTEMVNQFYDLVTDFYEYGWGESFHFAPRHRVESFAESLRRHEFFLALRLGLKPGMKCADLGCGVGGPMRSIARFSGATVVGINNNDYQIKVANRHNARDQLSKICNAQKADFMKLPFDDGHFDCAYAIEATCHAPDKASCYREIGRVIKEKGLFACYEWVMTDKYDKENKHHRALKEGIEVGNGLPDIATIPHVLDSLKKAGYEVLEYYDCATGAPHEGKQIPWYQTLKGAYSIREFRMTSVGRKFTHAFVTVLEAIKIAPKGSVKVSKILNDTANDLVAAGELGIFTPNFFFLARKL